MSKINNEINITNTGMTIVPYKKGQSKQIENDTAIWNKAYYKLDPVIGFTVHHSTETDTTSFVTVKNSENYIRSLFPNYIITHQSCNNAYKLSESFSLNSDISPTDIQSDIINSVLREKYKNEWFVNLPTGTGKTLLSIYLISILNTKALIMCYSTEILMQWIKTIKNKTDFNPSKILLLDSSKLLHNIYTGKFDASEYDIFLATPKLIVSYCDKYGFSTLNDIFNNIGIGIKIFDEAHRNIGNMVKINGYSNVGKTLYLSADFAQANHNKEKLYYKMMRGVPVFKPDKETLNSMKYTQCIIVEYDTEPDMTDISNVYTNHGFSLTNYMRYQFNNGMIVNALKYVLKNIFSTNDKGHKILILMNLIENVDDLYLLLKDIYGNDECICRFHSGIDENEKELGRTQANIIISTYGSFGTGIDINNIKYVISLDQCNKVADNQAAGRARPLSDGSDASYIILIDRGFKYAVNKLKVRVDYLYENKIKKVTRIKYYE